VVALAAMPIFAPLILLVAIVIWLQRDGPVLFYQTRIGFDGKPFACLKFRSMVAYSKERFDQYLEDNPSAKLEWLATYKLRNDPRITPFGRFLRKSSLDELPQLFNILRGDMSFVGPRPIVAGEISYYGEMIVYYKSARPGLTGLWQVSGRSKTSYEDRVAFDVTYVKTWTPFADVAIVLNTIPAVLLSKGSY
jgi:exopolysaccharide production protein ExoY